MRHLWHLTFMTAWSQQVVSENDEVYRAEYLAATILFEAEATEGELSMEALRQAQLREGGLAQLVSRVAATRYDEGYEGGVHGDTNVNEPDLILTDDRNLIDTSNTGSNGTVAYMGLRATLIAWHKADPVDDFERSKRCQKLMRFQNVSSGWRQMP